MFLEFSCNSLPEIPNEAGGGFVYQLGLLCFGSKMQSLKFQNASFPYSWEPLTVHAQSSCSQLGLADCVGAAIFNAEIKVFKGVYNSVPNNNRRVKPTQWQNYFSFHLV